jgi:transposase
MRFVTTKTTEQHDLQALHRVRERLVRTRTSISKRGSSYLRKLVIHGARSCYLNMNRSQHTMGPWIDDMANRGLHRNVIVVAIANKLARICWAVMRDGDVYHCARN